MVVIRRPLRPRYTQLVASWKQTRAVRRWRYLCTGIMGGDVLRRLGPDVPSRRAEHVVSVLQGRSPPISEQDCACCCACSGKGLGVEEGPPSLCQLRVSAGGSASCSHGLIGNANRLRTRVTRGFGSPTTTDPFHRRLWFHPDDRPRLLLVRRRTVWNSEMSSTCSIKCLVASPCRKCGAILCKLYRRRFL